MTFGPISPSEKVGICHGLVNNYEISWGGVIEGGNNIYNTPVEIALRLLMIIVKNKKEIDIE